MLHVFAMLGVYGVYGSGPAARVSSARSDISGSCPRLCDCPFVGAVTEQVPWLLVCCLWGGEVRLRSGAQVASVETVVYQRPCCRR
jgi:hypothetical protein